MPSITLFIAWNSLQSCHYLHHSKTKLWTPHCLSIKNKNISQSLYYFTLFYYSTLLEDILIKLITAAVLLKNDWIFPNLLRNRQISHFLAILLNKTV